MTGVAGRRVLASRVEGRLGSARRMVSLMTLRRSTGPEADEAAAGEGEEVAREVGGAAGGVFDEAEVFALLRIHVGGALEQPGEAKDGGEQVVEVVGDVAGHGAERLHLLALHELALQRFAFGDIAGEHEHGLAPAVGDERGDEVDIDEGAVMAAEVAVDEVEFAILQGGREVGGISSPVRSMTSSRRSARSAPGA